MLLKIIKGIEMEKFIEKEKVIGCLTKDYANFSGRASRSEYWYFALFIFLVRLALLLVFGVAVVIIGKGAANMLSNLIGGIFSLAVLVPSIAVGARRLHDINKTAWWMLIALIPVLGVIALVIAGCIKGTEGDNRFGSDPLQV